MQQLQEIAAKKVSYIFEALNKSEVSLIDFHRLTSISRNSLHSWKKGGPVRDRLRLDLAYGTAQRLELACRNGRLPLIEKLKEKERVKLLRKIISESK